MKKCISKSLFETYKINFTTICLRITLAKYLSVSRRNLSTKHKTLVVADIFTLIIKLYYFLQESAWF